MAVNLANRRNSKVQFEVSYMDFAVAAVVAVFFYLELSSGMGTPLCFDDCPGYIRLALTTGWREYFSEMGHLSRPFPVPVIFSFFGHYDLGAALRIVQFQTFLYFLSWTALAASVASLFSHRVYSRFVFLAVLSFMFGRSLPDLNLYLLSDSISISLQLLMLAILARCDLLVRLFAHRSACKRYGALCAFVLLAAFAVPARDTNALFLPVVFLAAPFLVPRGYRLHALAATVVVLLISVASLHSGGDSWRAQFNMRNLLVARILPDAQARAFFAQRGMPDGPEVESFVSRFYIEDWKFDPKGTTPAEVREGGAFRFGHRHVGYLMHSFLPRARGVYLRYLMAHPAGAIKTLVSQREIILNPAPMPYSTAHLSVLTRPCEDGCSPSVAAASIDISLFDRLPLDALLLLTGLAFGMRVVGVVKAGRMTSVDRTFVLALALATGGLTCAWGAHMGDYWETGEMMRHALAGSVFFKVGCGLMMFSALAAHRSLSEAVPITPR